MKPASENTQMKVSKRVFAKSNKIKVSVKNNSHNKLLISDERSMILENNPILTSFILILLLLSIYNLFHKLLISQLPRFYL